MTTIRTTRIGFGSKLFAVPLGNKWFLEGEFDRGMLQGYATEAHSARTFAVAIAALDQKPVPGPDATKVPVRVLHKVESLLRQHVWR